MKKQSAKLLCMLLSCLFCLSASAAGQERPSLFLGDEVWAEDSLLPFLEADGKQLLPVSAFAKMGVSLTLSEALGSLLLQKGDAYLSYNLSFGSVLDDTGAIADVTVYRYGGELYLDPHAVCDKFGLSFTTMYGGDGYLAARLTDGSEALTFSELLSLYTDVGETPLPYLYNPTGKTVGGTFMYPMILRPAAANVNGILRLLGKHNATFAFSPDTLQNYIDVLPAIYAAGHTVAYYMGGGDYADPDAFRVKMDEANELLFALIGKTARVYISSEIHTSIPDIDGYHKKSCRMHLVVGDLSSERVVNITLSESPGYGVFNFSLASDRETRMYYTDFFRRFDTFTHLRSMSVTESSAVQ